MINFNINLGSVCYPIYVADDIFQNLTSRITEIKSTGKVVIIVDEQIVRLRTEIFDEIKQDNRFYIYVIPGQKNNKTFYFAMKIFEFLDGNNISRDSTIVGIGGGVIGDLTGFIASCWYRGVDLIHIPTTLLSAVDSCVGGKTAVNFRSTVNAVGSYYHPKAILIDSNILLALPPREISSGFGEIIKYACLGCKEISNILTKTNNIKTNHINKLIELSLKEKEKFVKGDIGEQANRLFLNFGHTIGHAIEFSTIYNGEETLRHGEGVALGMLAIFRICVHLGYLLETDLVELRTTLSRYGLPVTYESASLGINRAALVDRVIELCFKDKKRTASQLRLILLNGIGNPFIYSTDDRELIKFGILEVIL